jgi:ABC-type nitrate/sulfonate/bicarbonate transport system permease component
MTSARRAPAEAWLRLLSLLGCLVAWQLVAQLGSLPLLPSPVVVLERLWRHLTTGELLRHLAITMGRVGAAFLISMAIGTALGILMGRHRWVDAGLDGLLVLALNIPALVTAILCYIWFGLTEVAAVTAVALNKIPTVVVTVREGARAVDHGLLDVATVFRVPRGRRFARVYLPQLYPYLMASARSGLALIWKIVLVVELLGRSNGIGFQLGTYFQFFDITSILAYTLAFAAAVLLIEGVGLRPLERRLTGWRA